MEPVVSALLLGAVFRGWKARESLEGGRKAYVFRFSLRFSVYGGHHDAPGGACEAPANGAADVYPRRQEGGVWSAEGREERGDEASVEVVIADFGVCGVSFGGRYGIPFRPPSRR